MTSSELVVGLKGWLRTVAYKFANEGYVDGDDYTNEAAVAILKAGVTEEPLAKTVALRAMSKYKRRHGLVRRSQLGRAEYDDLSKITYSDEPTGVFWDNLSDCMTAEQFRTLRLWAESGRTAAEIGTAERISVRTVNDRLKVAFQNIKEKWDDELGQQERRTVSTEAVCSGVGRQDHRCVVQDGAELVP